MAPSQNEKKPGFIGRLVAKDKAGAAGYLRCLNLANASLLVFSSFFSLFQLGTWLSVNISFIAITLYILCFGCMFCCFEMRFSYFERKTRNWFGFMYTYSGRTIFLFFVGTLVLGLVAEQKALGIAVGSLTIVNGFINCIVISRHPEMSMSEDPTGRYAKGGDITKDMAKSAIQNNPELSKKAANAAIDAARKNPDVAIAVASSAADASSSSDFQTSIY